MMQNAIKTMCGAAMSATITIATLSGAGGGDVACGALVAPGGSIATDGGSFVEPPGTVLLDAFRVVDILFPLEPVENPPIETVTVTFRSQVMRDPQTQRLTFVYRLEETPGTLPNLLDEKFNITIKSFDGFQTDVTSSVSLTVQRSADGGEINAFTPPPGVDEIELPTIVIATDATEFNDLGNIDGTISGGIPVPPPAASNLSTPFSLPGTYQPGGTGAGGGGGGGGGAAVPLPGALWTGMIMLGAGGAMLKRRGCRIITL
jgi:hypothetical protein